MITWVNTCVKGYRAVHLKCVHLTMQIIKHFLKNRYIISSHTSDIGTIFKCKNNVKTLVWMAHYWTAVPEILKSCLQYKTLFLYFSKEKICIETKKSKVTGYWLWPQTAI